MYQPFDSMSGHSRLWIYQADRKFTSDEKSIVETELKALCEQWKAHGAPLHTSFLIAFDQFVIMTVDEQVTGATGCSIDGSVRYLKGLQAQLGLDFFDRTKIAFLLDNKVSTYPLSSLKTLFQAQTVSSDTITFNNVLTTKADWEDHWQVQVKNSWLASYLPKSAVAG